MGSKKDLKISRKENMDIKNVDIQALYDSKIRKSDHLVPTNTQKEHLIPKPFKDVAKGMETQFAEYMIQQMNKTIDRKDDSSANNFYRSMMDRERAETMAQTNGGLGLQKLILNQIYPDHMRTQRNYNNYQQHEANKLYQMQKDRGVVKADSNQQRLVETRHEGAQL